MGVSECLDASSRAGWVWCMRLRCFGCRWLFDPVALSEGGAVATITAPPSDDDDVFHGTVASTVSMRSGRRFAQFTAVQGNLMLFGVIRPGWVEAGRAPLTAGGGPRTVWTRTHRVGHRFGAAITDRGGAGGGEGVAAPRLAPPTADCDGRRVRGGRSRTGRLGGAGAVSTKDATIHFQILSQLGAPPPHHVRPPYVHQHHAPVLLRAPRICAVCLPTPHEQQQIPCPHRRHNYTKHKQSLIP